jgi:hypothetical protein
MSAVTASDPHRPRGVPSVLRNLFLKVSHALEQHAQRRIQQAVHSSQLRRVQCDVIDLQREMHLDNSSTTKARRSARENSVSAMLITQRSLPLAAAGLSAAAFARGKTKHHRIARSDSDMPLAPSTPHAPQRPDSTILSEAIALFAIDCNKAGGVFWSKTPAIRFAKRTSGPDCASMVADGLELDQPSPQAVRCPNPATTRIARAIGAIKILIKRFLLACTKASKSSEQKALIEKGLYNNRYRHRSKSDDDLPIVR